MKVKMLEHYQDAQVHYLPDQEVDVSAELGAWLVEHRKAVRLEVVQAEVTTSDPDSVFVETETEAQEEADLADFEPSVDRKTKRGRGKK